MPIAFSIVCSLLDECHRISGTSEPTPNRAVLDWFARHRCLINAPDTDLAALLSTLLPEKRTDRVYCIKAPTLEHVIGKALLLGSSRLTQLGLYRRPGLGLDLAHCLERILTETPNPLCSQAAPITVEEIDDILHNLASKIKWSSPSIRSSRKSESLPGRSILANLYRRMTAREAKWFTRLILKDYRPVNLDPQLIYRCCDAALPLILKVHDDFAIAVQRLQSARSETSCAYSVQAKDSVLASMAPIVGVKVGRQNWFKGRSIKHCLDMGHGRMSVEDKVDGEYCQIHVKLVDGRPDMQIFSKSGKDSTEDRFKLRSVIIKSLGLHRTKGNVQQNCILEAELVVHNDLTRRILPFHRIRNHVARRGRLMNVDMDSPPRWYENLMVVYYDILLLDGESLLHVCHSDRFNTLKRTIEVEPGRAELVKRKLIDFQRSSAASELRKVFAAVIKSKGEGLVLKPDQPYFDLQPRGGRISGLCIKLKKEYIGGFGDVGDFAVVGAGFNPVKAASYRMPNVKWTVFYLGCLNNKEHVQRWGAMPEFTVVCAVEIGERMLKTFGTHGHPVPVPADLNDATTLHVPHGIEADAPLSVAFQNPLVFDLRCFGFDKPGNVGFWTLRFPTVSKIHFDRDYTDSLTFDDLQKMAEEARMTPDLEDSQENLQWIARLERADPGGCAVDAVSQLTASTMASPSPLGPPSPSSSAPANLDVIIPGDTAQHPNGLDLSTGPAVSLITPPLSSFREAPASAHPENKKKRKLSEQSLAIGSPTRQHCATILRTASTVPPAKRAQNPLDEIDANVSHCFGIPSHDVIDNRWKEREQLDGVASSPKPKMDRRYRLSADACHEPGVMTEERNRHRRPSSSSSLKTPPAVQCERAEVPIECQYSGKKCHLLGSIVLLASAALRHSTERDALLKAHGVSKAVVDMSKWFEENNFGETMTSKSLHVIILVDTLEKADETKKVLSMIEQTRKELPRKSRGWIAAYDWRILEHLGVIEDEASQDKYLDGFDDPWRRWYCGIV